MSTETYPAVSPYLTVSDAAKAIAFYEAAFGAAERYRLSDASGKVGHAELMIHGSVVMLSDENPKWNKSPETLGGTPVKFVLMVDNADAAVERATAAGATVVMPPMDMFYGFRCGSLKDPFGHEWMVQHRIESVSPEEMQKRWDAMGAQCGDDA